jgi:outer membrane biosynthesis protein TonB
MMKMVKHRFPRITLSIPIFPAFLFLILSLFYFYLIFPSQAEEIKGREKTISHSSFGHKSKIGKNESGPKALSKQDTAKADISSSPTADLSFLFAESKKTCEAAVTDKSLNSAASTVKGQVPQWLASLAGINTADDKSEAGTTDNRSVGFISQRINSHNEEIQDCYYNYLKINPDIAGQLVVRIFINGEGKVHKAELVKSSIGEAELEREILEKIERWDDFEKSSQKSLHVYRQEYIFGE